MDQITVNKVDLIATLRENQQNHRNLFEIAQDVYREKMIAELDRALDEARNGGKIKRAFALPVPEDHTEDFDTAIGMLTWHQGDQVELTHREYTQYVENKWGWDASFRANTASYVVG